MSDSDSRLPQRPSADRVDETEPRADSPVTAREPGMAARESSAKTAEPVSVAGRKASRSPERRGRDRSAKNIREDSRRPVCQDVAGLIRRAYGPGAKGRLTLSRGEVLAAARNAALTDSERDDVLLLAREDATLERTRELLLLLEDAVGLGAASATVRGVVGDVLRGHPVFGGEALQACLEKGVPELSLDEAARSVYAQILKSPLRNPSLATRPKKELARCHENAVHCLLLMWRADHQLSVTDLLRLLLTTSWGGVRLRQKTDAQRLRTILLSHDPEAAVVAASGLLEEVNSWSQQSERARREAAGLKNRVAGLQETVVALTDALEGKRKEAKSLLEALEAERKAWADERSHLVDEREALKGRILRRLKDEASLLGEGLQALRRSPPKVHVMEDHVERAIEGLRTEIERIREGNA